MLWIISDLSKIAMDSFSTLIVEVNCGLLAIVSINCEGICKNLYWTAGGWSSPLGIEIWLCSGVIISMFWNPTVCEIGAIPSLTTETISYWRRASGFVTIAEVTVILLTEISGASILRFTKFSKDTTRFTLYSLVTYTLGLVRYPLPELVNITSVISFPFVIAYPSAPPPWAGWFARIFPLLSLTG